MQAEEEQRAAEEAARLEAEAAEGNPAVAQMKRILNKTKSGAKVADAFKQLEVEGGLAGKWKVLYEVSHDLDGMRNDCQKSITICLHSLA